MPAIIRAAIRRAFDSDEIDISARSRQKLIAALADSNRWLDDRYCMPTVTAPECPADAPAAGRLDLEIVFSSAMVELLEQHIGGACDDSELLRKLSGVKGSW
jgi:hypothetical protein